jgi:hypothetical protein
VTIREINMHFLHDKGKKRTGTYHMYFPRRAVGHVLEAPIAHPQDARILTIDSASEEVHRASMPDNILTIAVRERVRRKVPVGGG